MTTLVPPPLRPGDRVAVVAPGGPPRRAALLRGIAWLEQRQFVVDRGAHVLDRRGYLAGDDAGRADDLNRAFADPGLKAVWFARGGYGSNRIAEAVLGDLPEGAEGKIYLGYSDAGFLLAGLHKAGLNVAWGPMPQDILRAGGEAAIGRALDWLVRRDPAAIEPDLQPPAMAFNLTVLSNLLGTPLEPDFAGVDLMVEDLGEHLYRIDRTMFHVTASSNIRGAARLRLGRVADVLPNDVEFGADEVAIVSDWCARSGIAYGGRADIGHDTANRVVPFGRR